MALLDQPHQDRSANALADTSSVTYNFNFNLQPPKRLSACLLMLLITAFLFLAKKEKY